MVKHGSDTVNNYILKKKCAHALSFPLAELLNASFRSATVPILWKEANVTPVYKKDDSSDCRNYRPISLLSTVGKVLEKNVHKSNMSSTF